MDCTCKFTDLLSFISFCCITWTALNVDTCMTQDRPYYVATMTALGVVCSGAGHICAAGHNALKHKSAGDEGTEGECSPLQPRWHPCHCQQCQRRWGRIPECPLRGGGHAHGAPLHQTQCLPASCAPALAHAAQHLSGGCLVRHLRKQWNKRPSKEGTGSMRLT